MSIKNIIFSGLAIAAFSTLAAAQGGQPNPQPQPRREGGVERMERREMRQGFRMQRPGMQREMRGEMRRGGGMNFERLNLTDAQKQRIQAIMETNRKNMEAARAQREEMGRLMGLKSQGLLTTEQGTRLTSLQAQMKTNAERSHNEILAVLTPEQKTLMDQMRTDRGPQMRMRMMRDRMPMRRGPGGQNKPMPAKPAAQPQTPTP